MRPLVASGTVWLRTLDLVRRSRPKSPGLGIPARTTATPTSDGNGDRQPGLLLDHPDAKSGAVYPHVRARLRGVLVSLTDAFLVIRGCVPRC